MILLSSFFGDFQLLFRGKEPAGPASHVIPATSVYLALFYPEVWLHFKRMKQREAEPSQGSWEKLPKKLVLVLGTALIDPTAIAQHLDALEHPSCLDLSCLFEESGMHVWAVTRS